MDTPYTIRAQELRDIYSTLSMKYLTQDERLDVLLTLKHTVKEHDCKLTQEIIELIDREADLLMRGVKESNLEGKEKCSVLYVNMLISSGHRWGDRGVRTSRLPYPALPLPVPLSPTSRPFPCCSCPVI